MAQLVHSAQRAAYNVAIRQAIKYVKKDGADKYEQIGKLIDLVEKITGSNYPPEGYAKARQLLANPDEKWARFLARSLDELDDNVIATTLLNLGFETFIEGTKQIRENRKKPRVSDFIGYGARFHKLRTTEEWMKELREGEEE